MTDEISLNTATRRMPLTGGGSIVLSGEKHDTALTERLGQFSAYCGCGLQALDFDTPDDAYAELSELHERGPSDEAVEAFRSVGEPMHENERTE